MPIVQKGEINATALVVPDVYVQIVPPQTQLLNGVPTNVLGIVGTGQWGPTNVPVTVSSMASYSRQFGSITTDAHDLGTAAATAVLQGANNLRCVRVSDGSDVAASADVDRAESGIYGFRVTSKYTGSLANKCEVNWSAGSASTSSALTYKVTVTMPGQIGEVFDNIAEGTDAAGTWANAISAINLGQNALRGPSRLITASASTNAKNSVGTASEVTLAGGTDGTAVDSADLLGAAATKTGIYALTERNVTVAFISGQSDSSAWGSILSFAKQQGIYWILAGPASTALSTLTANKKTAGVDSPFCKVLAGDWVYFNDSVNGQVRLVSPAGYVAGRLANLSPEQSSLNKRIYGVVGTEKSYAGQFYSSAEIQQFAEAGIDLIANPSPGGDYYSCRIGHNASTNPTVNGDNYTRLTNFIAATLDKGLGAYIGRLQSSTVRSQAASTLSMFLGAMADAGQIGNAAGTEPFTVVLDDSNNSSSRVALGYMTADITVQYLSVIEKFIVNVEGGQSVEIIRAETTAVAADAESEEG